uniref:Two-component response regulator-like APRR7 n=2 Tax=Rhizophora mucronata TaxID=61149 RepID=A0A2P2LFQ6_RHIMU
MNINHDGDKDLRELNHRLHQGNNRVRDGVVSEENNLVEENGLKVNGIIENVKDGHCQALQAPALQPTSQQQQSHCWEKFLHLRSLKVMLVENDDSTRHVVTALLRNCSYEVIEAANGLQAWKILEDLTNHIDLVLTEVVMPSFSGIALLCKIMSHKTRRNVPVIMMSSHDSMGLVFKCLSKGAVDFLVKPIRKNELKNLWQHVWRRCHSSSSSGSESGTQSQKSIKSRSAKRSDNNTGSNNEDDNGSIGLNGDGSEDGSSTQGSWTKQAFEVDSPQPVSPLDHISECPDSTCAQVIHSNSELSGSKQVPLTVRKEYHEQQGKLENGVIAKDLKMSVPRKLDLQLKYPVEDSFKVVGSNQNNVLEWESIKVNEQIDNGQLEFNSETPSGKAICKSTNLTGTVINATDLQNDNTEFEPPSRHSKILDAKSRPISETKEIPSLELSLKRQRGVKDSVTTVQDERNVLRRSDSSAFSRYNAASNANQASREVIKSGSTQDTGLVAAKKRLVYDWQSQSNGDHPNQSSNMGSNNIDTGSTTNNTFNRSIVKNKPAITSSVKCLHPPSASQPMKGDILGATKLLASKQADDMAGTVLLAQSRGIQQEVLLQHLTQHHDHHHHLGHKKQQQQLPPDLDDSSLKKMAAPSPRCRSSNVLGGPAEVNAGNYSINGSASGSNHGSNGQIGSNTVVNAGVTNAESDNGMGGKSGSGDASWIRSENRIDQGKLAQREAALTKFRQKRKERCFKKKVRYQSRQRLAEQRPRVRGQFVRQMANQNTSRVTES